MKRFSVNAIPFRLLFPTLLVILLFSQMSIASEIDDYETSFLKYTDNLKSDELDSLVSQNRYAACKFLQKYLEQYFDTGNDKLLRLNLKVAELVDQHFDDSFYLIQCTHYRRWCDNKKRQQLKSLFEETSRKIHLLPTDTSLSRYQLLAEGFLELGDSAGSVKALQHAASIASSVLADSQSLKMLWQSIEISRAIGDLDGLARSFNLVGSYYSRRGYYLQAGDNFDSARVIRVELEDYRGVAGCLNNIAGVYVELDDFEYAERFLRESLRIRRELSDSLQICSTLLNMVTTLGQYVTHSELIQWITEVEVIANKWNDTELMARVLLARATIARTQGDYNDALSFYQQAKSMIADQNLPQLEITLLTNLALHYQVMGDYEQALRNYFSALEKANKIGSNTKTAKITHNIGVAHQILGDFNRAVDYYNQSLVLKRKLGQQNEMVSTLNNLAEIYLEANDHQTALEYLDQAHQIAYAYGNKSLIASTSIIIAKAIQPDNYDLAITYLDSALAIFQVEGNLQEKLDVYILRSEFARIEGDFAGAKADLDQSQVILRRLSTYLNLQKLDLSYGLLYYDMRLLDSARFYLGHVISRLEHSRRKIPDRQLRAFQQSKSRFVYEKMALIFLKQLDNTGDERYLDSIVYYAELGKSRTLLDLTSQVSVSHSSKIPRGLLDQQQQLIIRIEQLESRLTRESKERAIDSIVVVLSSLTQELNLVRLKISLADQRARQVYEFKRTSLASLQKVIATDSIALLNYLLTPEQSLLLVTTKEGLRLFKLPSRSEITIQLADYLRLLHQSVENELLLDSLTLAANNLSKLVFAGFTADISQYEKLYIIPDGALNVLPFESLIIDNKYLVEYASVAMLPSSRFLGEKQSYPSKTKYSKLLALADPKFAAGEHQLPYSRREVETIAPLFNQEGSIVLTGENAGKSALLSCALSSFDYLHFATHALINQDDPLRSRILLAVDSATESADYLSLAEVMTLDLDADLVVLSACESGGGSFHLGEGIEGFVKGFFYAGAHNVIVSLWSVEDFTTSLLMKEFYDALENGYAEALREAKLKLINSPRRRHRHPHYWSPFVLIKGQ